MIVITTPEPTAVSDAYALVKILFGMKRRIRFRTLINLVESEAKFQDTPVQMSRQTVEAIDFAAGGGGVATEVQETAGEEKEES